MSDGVLFIDNQNTVTVCNDRAAELRGVSSSYIIGRPVDACHPSAVLQKVLKLIERIKANPDETHSRIVVRDQRHYEINYSAVLTASDKVMGVLAISREITDRVKMTRKLQISSTTDEMTRLFNHRHFLNTLKTEVARAKRAKRPLGLLLFDLDNFKAVNDTYGHEEGDVVLTAIGRIVKKHIRGGIDMAFRYGGDEFTIILPEATLIEAERAGERLRKVVAAASLYGVTLSAGAAELGAEDSIAEIVQAADSAMYAAKKAGGNRVYQAGTT